MAIRSRVYTIIRVDLSTPMSHTAEAPLHWFKVWVLSPRSQNFRNEWLAIGSLQGERGVTSHVHVMLCHVAPSDVSTVQWGKPAGTSSPSRGFTHRQIRLCVRDVNIGHAARTRSTIPTLRLAALRKTPTLSHYRHVREESTPSPFFCLAYFVCF